MKKRYVLAVCLVGVLALTGCGNKNTLMKKSDVTAEEKDTDSKDEGDKDEALSDKESKDGTTEAYENATRVVERNMSEKLSSSAGDVTVMVGTLDGYVRNFGSSELIQYLSEGNIYTDISYQLYEGYGMEQVKKLSETFANSKDYGNVIKDKVADFSVDDYNGFTLSYENNGKVVYELVLVKEVNSNCLLAITVLQDNTKIDNDKMSKLVTGAVTIAASQEETTEDSSENTSEEATSESTEEATEVAE